MFPNMKKEWKLFIVITLILIILNPSYSNFKEYTGLTGKSAEYLHKKNNFLLFSIYENSADEKKYLAVLMNFIDITYHPSLAKEPELKDSAVEALPINKSPVIYKTSDGQIVSHEDLIYSGYSEERINKGLQNGILKRIADAKISDTTLPAK